MPPSALKSSDVFATLGLSLSVFVLAGPWLAGLGSIGIVITQVSAFAMPALLVAVTREQGFRSIGIATTSPLTLLAAAFIAASLWYWNAYWIAPIGEGWVSVQVSEAWSETLSLDKRPIVESILLFALLPALCEELLHRGIIAPALARKLGFAGGLILSSLIFGLMHFNLARLLPTTLLGLAAGFVRLRSGSLWPAILLHFLYNAALLLAARAALSLTTPIALLSVVATAIAVIMLAKVARLQRNDVS